MNILVAQNFHWWVINGMEVILSGTGSCEVGIATAKANHIEINEYQLEQVA